jgi:hypothetical protein
MGAVTRASALYTAVHVNKYLVDARDLHGMLVPIPFRHTVVSGEIGGASAGARDKVQLCVIPANWMPIALHVSGDNIWASAGTNGTFQIGDATDDDRYMIAAEFYTASGGPLEAGFGRLAFAGFMYRPTADVIVLGEWRGANPVVGKTVRGCFICIKPA